ncbi:hypothetical protein [Rufibacter psychrotolerans]|uniref:hypothetical protein n=1 Tax=Rufibacter psychrotolerans TaxID=2812556 RepID=UPI00196885F9|nr:hypothetical protein [Rufibacter sp. SYSU D00308]
MMDFVRALFGMKADTGQREVVGNPAEFGLQEAGFIQESNRRLTQLQELTTRYQGTPHAAKMKAAFEKTRTIHSYLVARKKVHELEMFHLQNTDHFLTTFTAILDVHQKFQHLAPASNGAARGKETPLHESRSAKLKRLEKAANLPELVRPVQNSVQYYHDRGAKTSVPRLYVPEISINTVEKVTYYSQGKKEELVPKEVGFTSSKEEKEAFLEHLLVRLGLPDASYVGNALVTIPNNNGITPTGLVPVLHWEGCLYALNLNDYRLFPVRIYRAGVR